MPPRELPVEHKAEGLRIAIVVARFNQNITQKLLDGALACLKEYGASDDSITVAYVPGSFELPIAAKAFAETGDVNAVICIGAVIRGETAHFDYVSSAAAEGILQVSLETDVPVIFSVLTTENLQQAQDRSCDHYSSDLTHGNGQENAGYKGALSAIEMANLLEVVHAS